MRSSPPYIWNGDFRRNEWFEDVPLIVGQVGRIRLENSFGHDLLQRENRECFDESIGNSIGYDIRGRVGGCRDVPVFVQVVFSDRGERCCVLVLGRERLVVRSGNVLVRVVRGAGDAPLAVPRWWVPIPQGLAISLP